MLESNIGTTFIAEWVNDGVGVKITVKNMELKNLNDSKKSIISMVSALFKKLEESNISEKPINKKLCDKKSYDKKPCIDANLLPLPTTNKEKIKSDIFIQACISCLNDKKTICALDICNPTSNKHLPKSYELIGDSDNIILNFKQKIDLLRTNSRIEYNEITKIFSLKEE